MNDFKELIELIQEAIDRFTEKVPGIQRSLMEKLRAEIKELNVKNGNISVSTENLKKIVAIKGRLLEIILSPEYVKEAKALIKTYDQITTLQNKYFSSVSSNFSPPEFGKELKEQARQSLVDSITERGMEANVVSGIEDILRKNITGGGSYAEMDSHLQNYLTNNETGEGKLLKYTKQIVTDALNQYSAQYTQLVSNDLGYEWFKYAGSNIETTRPFCLACTKRGYIHVSEFPALLAGNFPEFKEFDGVMYKGLPAGMYPDTTPSNFQVNRGGFNCGHQLRPVNEAQVPVEARNRVYALPAYSVWKSARAA